MPLTSKQRQSLQLADREGAALVTMIDGRVAIILPALPERELAPFINRVIDGLAGAGIGVAKDKLS